MCNFEFGELCETTQFVCWNINLEELYMKCPKCGSENLETISDVKGKGASFWKLCCCGLLGLCGAGKTTTTHYWVCKDCGNKFKM